MNLNKEDILTRLPDDKGLGEWNILLAYRGSIAHNTYIPNTEPNSTDDIDLIGICIPTIDYYFGLKEYGSRGTVPIFEGNLDIVIFEFKKLISMLSGCNPNVINLLWTKPEHFLNISPAGQMLIDNRDLFLSKQAYYKFGGYAKGQLSEMKKDVKQGYMGKKREELVNKFGYDPKNASHLIRLLKMCEELLLTGKVNAFREDREELIAIKTGQYELEEIMEISKILSQKCDEAYEKSVLPESIDLDKVNDLSVEVMMLHFKEGY